MTLHHCDQQQVTQCTPATRYKIYNATLSHRHANICSELETYVGPVPAYYAAILT